MHFAQYYLDCLSQASYLIGDETTGRAVLVDPRRDIDDYLQDAAAAGLRIELVIETHVHADFLSGHLELARATGATIAFGEAARTGFPIRRLRDGERIFLGEAGNGANGGTCGNGGEGNRDEGNRDEGGGGQQDGGARGGRRGGVTLTVLATPGHTLESLCLVVHENPDDPVPFGVLTGDTLFVGDVGRPDLLSAAGHSPHDMAVRLHHSLHTKLLTLPDATRVFPAHGAGSACGRSLSTETSSTIGDQRRLNYALQPMPVAEFVRLVTAGQPATPGYFAHDAALNRDGHPLLDAAEPPALTLEEALAARDQQGAVLLDCRPLASYTRAHLKGSLHTSLDTRFAEYAGSVVAPGTPIVLLADPGKEREARLRLARIGYDHVLGHLPDPAAVLDQEPALVRRSHRVRPEELPQAWRELPVGAPDADLTAASDTTTGTATGTATAMGTDPGWDTDTATGPDTGGRFSRAQLVDVRNPAEYAAGALPGARSIPLATLPDRITELDPARPVVLYCRSGNRSVIAAALLEARGFGDVCDVEGGYEAMAGSCDRT
ncbi:MBL fold metallo-hydrolase [Streptomyces sp. NRRL S-337]|uniref:MBL fold metallo-hydrolase n=1 Tax=Streptomyces sp. NRRL S-337 TaxID=1463900 RepID=UPI0004C65B5D|nr:MBL fold metallo-hydrolase [Streptomyces sp. NRRL S-337]